MKTFWLFLLLSVFMIENAHSQKTDISLDTGWAFREAGKPDWHSATVPGCVHTDLLANKLIEDPFYRDNEKKQQWIGKTDWEYQTTFKMSPELLNRQNIEIVFEGLDTYANVFVNDKPVLDADNMFRRWRVDVKNALRPGENTLRIRFRSPINEILPLMAKLDYELPAVNDQGEKTSPYTRKAPYQYGWDWGPRFVTSGVWKPARIEAWDNARIDDLHIRQNALTKNTADLTAAVEAIASAQTDATIEIENVTDKKVVAIKQVKLTAGVNKLDLSFTIANPKLWYPIGLGDQALYTFRARLMISKKPVDEATKRTGLRTLELRQKPDEYGKSFEFIVNGIPVFGHGANWIPADIFPTRVTHEKYDQLLGSIRDANMNMVRVWGGGIYEDDHFYDLADQMGILVWQDFMFACSMYPGDKPFLDNVRHEAVDNVKRLRDHPAIVIWVGNNEIETAWQHWGGWKDKNPDSVWKAYMDIFLRLLPDVLDEYDPSRPYWQSSPSSNFQADSEFQGIGDTHYWQVWHAEKPFSEYEKQFPRFMSEYGFQSFPELDTVKSYTTDEDRASIETPVMLSHQRHPRGNQLVRTYMLREYDQPKDFESFLFVSQVLQAEGIKLGAEHLRRIMPRNMGSLYWQANDTWPVASWSSMDYYGRWKALMYYTRRFYSPMLVSPHVEDGKMEIYVVSDHPTGTNAELLLTLIDLDGKILDTRRQAINVEPLRGKSYMSLSVAELLASRDDKNIMLIAELKSGGKILSQNEYYFRPFKELALTKPNITTDITSFGSQFKIRLATDKLAKDVYLTVGGDGRFTDNYVTLIPGRPAEIEFDPLGIKMNLAEFKKALRIRSLKDAF
ncbi:MAG: glycoside hydrolase family 2 protein [Acidobacteriota bacterium]